MKLIFKIFYLAQHIHSIIISTCNQYKNHESILNFFVLLKMCMYFTLIAHLLLDKPPFKCPGALCGQWLLATTLGSTALGLQARISQSLEITQITNICWCLLCVWLCYQMCHINALNESLIQSLHPHTISSIIIPIIRKKKARFWAAVTDLKSQWQVQDSDLEGMTLERMFLATAPAESKSSWHRSSRAWP